MAGCFSTIGAEVWKPSPALARQRPATVSHTGRSWGQQCCWSSQQVASGRGQQAHVKQKPKNSRMQQQVLSAGHCWCGGRGNKVAISLASNRCQGLHPGQPAL